MSMWKCAYDLDMAIWARREEEESSRTLTPEVIQLLDAIDLTAVVLAPGEVPIYYSQSATNFGIIKGERIVPENLLALLDPFAEVGRAKKVKLKYRAELAKVFINFQFE